MSIDSLNSAETSHILGVDFGLSKIGLAIADSETKMAFALDVLKNDEEFLAKLKEIVDERDVKMIIIGMTSHEKDPDSVKMKNQFAELLQQELKLEVFFQEEMFTTKMAHANIKLHGTKNISQTDDKEAARIILQEWLDMH